MKIYQQRTVVPYALIGLVPVILITFAGSAWVDFDLHGLYILFGIAIPLSVAIFLYGAWRYTSLKKQIDSHEQLISDFATKNGLTFSAKSQEYLKYFDSMSLVTIDKARNPRAGNFVHSSGWDYCDYAYDYYQRYSKYGDEYKAGTVYYGVLAAKLPRMLPHVFFYSTKARGRQFRFVFAADQKYSFEGDFDKYFSSYFPEGYDIDSLSFITPDVMQALIMAADYDIEIIGDTLYMYGPIADTSEIERMVQLLELVKKELTDNVTSYRDERLPFYEGKERVSAQGVLLDRSKLLKRIVYATTPALVIAYLLMGLLNE